MRRFLTISISAALAWIGPVVAQDAEIGLGGASIQFQLSVGSETADGISPVLTFAQVDPGLPSEPQALVRMPRVIDDLQLIDSQLAEIRERTEQTVKKYHRRREDLASKYGEKANESEEFVKDTNRLNEAQKKELMEIVESVLLPFQRTRLKQISTQAKLNAVGSSALDEFAKELDLTEEQTKKLTDSADDFERKLREEIRELRRKRQRELLESVLTKEQEKKLDEMLGEDLPDEKPKSPEDKK